MATRTGSTRWVNAACVICGQLYLAEARQIVAGRLCCSRPCAAKHRQQSRRSQLTSTAEYSPT